jgi:hypothetical protein
MPVNTTVKKVAKEVELPEDVATINIVYTLKGGGYHIDIKCNNAHLIGTGRSERIASRMRKEIHRQRYHNYVTAKI